MTDELRLPCRESDTPDDWFISRDGKQYPSDDLLTDPMREAVTAEADRKELEGEERVAWIERNLDRFEVDAKTASLQRRRHAKQGCYDCAFRTRCLDMALTNHEVHGTWGGYYEEEIATLQREISRRRGRELRILEN